MESKVIGFRINPVEDRLLKKYLREKCPENVENKSNLLRNLVSEFLTQQGLM
jgi:hypothetical protein